MRIVGDDGKSRELSYMERSYISISLEKRAQGLREQVRGDEELMGNEYILEACDHMDVLAEVFN